MGIRVMVATGGTRLYEDIKRIEQGVHVVVATPGRLVDLATRPRHTTGKVIADLSNVHTIALDEADKMVDDFFIASVENIIECTRKDRQMLLLSATFPNNVTEFARDYMPG